MKKLFTALLLILSACQQDHDYNWIDHTIESLKRSEYYEAEKYAKRIQNQSIKELFLYQINYKTLNVWDSTFDPKEFKKPTTRRLLVVYKNLYGDYLNSKKDTSLYRNIRQNHLL